MSDIFISYASKDRKRIQPIIQILESMGWSVWWDRKIPLGKTFDVVIEDAIDAAKCVIVIWTKNSVSSKWVRTEASEGESRGILIPIQIEDVKIPLAFRRIETAQLADWDGISDHPEIEIFLDAVIRIVGNPKDVGEDMLDENDQPLQNGSKIESATEPIKWSSYDEDDYDQAITDYTNAIKLDSQNAEYFYSRGKIYSLKYFETELSVDYKQAIADLTRAIELDPDNAEYYYSRGSIYEFEFGRNDEPTEGEKAIQDLTRATKLDPNKAEYFIERATTNVWGKNFDLAYADLMRAKKLEPDNAEFFFTLGWMYVHRDKPGDRDRALANITRAIEIDPKPGYIHWLGLIKDPSAT